MAAGASTATVTFSSAMSSANYAAVVQITDNPNFTVSSGWGYLEVTGESTTGFTVDLRTSGGATEAVPSGQSVTLDWTAILNN